MRGVVSFSLIAVFLLSSTRTGANEVQSNASTTKCKPHPYSGMPGIPGNNGVPGIPGAPGSPGRDGSKGGKGTVGRRGFQGAIGIPGKIGPRGFEGPPGEMGENGTVGTKGSTGTPGNIGPRGLKGSQGTSGIGTKGSTGTPGNIGPRGFKGSQGTSGIGTKGSTGTPGNIGPRGPKGSQGTSGTGTKGEKGDAASIDPRQRANWKQCAWQAGTNTDSGKIKECSFNKLHGNTALRVSYQGNIRLYSDHACSRWYFKFNSNECSDPMSIESVLYTNWRAGIPDVRPHLSIEGYCENLPRGTVSVELWVGQCSSITLGDAHTGWNSASRIMIEEVPPSQ